MRRFLLLGLMTPSLLGCGGSGGSSSSTPSSPNVTSPNQSGGATSSSSSSTPTPGTGTIIGISTILENDDLSKTSYSLSPSTQLNIMSGLNIGKMNLEYTKGDFTHKLEITHAGIKDLQGHYTNFKTAHSLNLSFHNIILIPQLSFSRYNISLPSLDPSGILSDEARLDLKTSFNLAKVKFSPEGSLFLRNFSDSVPGGNRAIESGFSLKMNVNLTENMNSSFYFVQTHRECNDQSQVLLEFSARF